MSPANYLLDTGPLVALVFKNDEMHERAKSIFSALEGNLLTCEPVLTEAAFLIRKAGREVQQDLLQLAIQEFYKVDFRLAENWSEIINLMGKYHDQPISLADACLIRMAEIHNQPQIITFDSDFEIYRWGRRRKFQILT